MNHPLASVISNSIFRVPYRRKRKPELTPAQIPSFDYTAHLADVRWLRLHARRPRA